MRNLNKDSELESNEYLIENLEPATTYTVKIRVETDDFGNSEWTSTTVLTKPEVITGKLQIFNQIKKKKNN